METLIQNWTNLLAGSVRCIVSYFQTLESALHIEYAKTGQMSIRCYQEYELNDKQVSDTIPETTIYPRFSAGPSGPSRDSDASVPGVNKSIASQGTKAVERLDAIPQTTIVDAIDD